MPQLLNATTLSLIVSGVALGLLAIPIRRLMQGAQDQRERRLPAAEIISVEQ
jgi:hypothetical protein